MIWDCQSISASSAGKTTKRAGRPVREERGPAQSIMPKTAKNLWSHIVTLENLLEGWRNASKGKRPTLASAAYWYALDKNLLETREQLLNKTWMPKPWRQFTVCEPKVRLIQAPAFSDRIVHHALMGVVQPFFSRRFILDSYACQKGKGTHMASRRTTDFLRAATARWEHPYIIKADISKYFPSISHDILFQRLERLFGDKDVLWLFRQIVYRCGFVERGIPIGCLTSQWLANLYLDPLDHFIKDEMGLDYYIRYMDDFVIIGPNKEWCRTVLEQVERFVTLLQLKLNPKTGIYPASHGIDFVGYRHWTTHTLPRKRTMFRARRQLRRLVELYYRGRIDADYIRPRIASWTGYVQHCDAHIATKAILDDLVFIKPPSD